MTPNKKGPMFTRLRDRLSYANVVATLALFVALGGTSYAAFTITGANVKDGSLTGKDLKRNSLTGRQIREGRLDTVPRARNAARVGGLTAKRLLVKCPSRTLPAADTCVETQAHPPVPYSNAAVQCDSIGAPRTPGRRLPTHGELRTAFKYDQISLSPGGELTANVYPSSSLPGDLDVVYVTDEVGHVGLTSDRAEGAKAFRCVADPLN